MKISQWKIKKKFFFSDHYTGVLLLNKGERQRKRLKGWRDSMMIMQKTLMLAALRSQVKPPTSP